MKKLYALFLIPLLAFSFESLAQQPLYGNEWINYNLTYFKFKTGAEGVYRIPKSALDAQGIPANNGAAFMLFRDGKEVPLFVSANGAFASGDFIEFYAAPVNGKLDEELYANPSWHPTDKVSLFTDSVSFFLAVDNSAAHIRYAQIQNTIPVSPTAQSVCFVTSGFASTKTFFPGQHLVSNYPIYSALFENGEGFADSSVSSTVPITYSIATPNLVSGGQNAQLFATVLRQNYPTNPSVIPLRIYVNGQQVADSSFSWDETQHFDLSIAASLLSGNNAVQVAPISSAANSDFFGVSFLALRYPRNFDVNGLSYFRFELAPSSAKQYLEFLNFNHGGTAPKLYDVTNNKSYAGDISQTGKTRFYVDESLVSRELILVAANSFSNIPTLKSTPFSNYANAANEGDYIIITHKNYEATTSGQNQVQAYKNYRSSAAGGSRTALIADVSELYDQFAYGVEMHPLSVRHFLEYAYNNWSTKPHDVFLIGKGIFYPAYRKYLQNPGAYPYPAVVPTFGEPGADVDFVNFLPNRKQAMNIARLSAWNTQEISDYLEKVKAYETALNNQPLPTAANSLWKKKALHAAGGNDGAEQASFIALLDNGASYLKDTAFGGHVSTIAKNVTVPIDNAANAITDSLINNGLAFIVYQGHANPSGFQINTLNDPNQYHNAPKSPHFVGLGCDIAQIFTLSQSKTISEKYVASIDGGSVSIIASDNLQYASFHVRYLPTFYNSVSQKNYGQTIGDHHRFAYDSLRSTDNSSFTFFHLESLLLQGDPAVRVPGDLKPDYHVSNSSISSIPSNVTTNLDSFKLRIVAYNLGRAIADTVRLKVEHTTPSGQTSVVQYFNLVNLYYSDTAFVNIPIDKTNNLGLNRFKVTIDDDGIFDETSELNNDGTLEVFIFSDNLVPVYPKEFSIVNQQNITLKASTLNAFKGIGNYRIELDTTELFNSPLKQQTQITSGGGVIKWKPNITYLSNKVYYWRTAFDSVQNGGYQWSYSSFIYLPNSSPGWNQSHYYQYLKDGLDSLEYGTDRVFKFPAASTNVQVSNAVFSEDGSTPWSSAEFIKVVVNGSDVQRLGCAPFGGTLQVLVFDSVTNALWTNAPNGTAGAYGQCLSNRNVYAFEFPVYTKQGRDDASKFIRDSIPNGNFVLLRNLINNGAYTPSYVDDWKADTLINGSGQSLYHVLKNLGFLTIDSFNQKRVFIFLRKKGSNAFPVYQYFGADEQDRIVHDFVLPATRSNGKLLSTVIGPAKQWNTLKWQTSALDNQPLSDNPEVIITGIDTNNVNAVLYRGNSRDTGIGFISAIQFPNIRMTWRSEDTARHTSPQLDYWRVLYNPVPEAALNPSLNFTFKDTVQAGQIINFSTAIENLTDIPMDSMLVRYKLIDAGGASHELGNLRYKKLNAESDTLHASFDFNPQQYAGSNVFFIEANPDDDQPEQYHPNNLGYLPLFVENDGRNPLLDVTFDGVHILDRDIVSAKPFIKISLKDENKFLALDDTSLLRLSIRYPDDPSTQKRNIPFDGTIARFIPASGTEHNRNEAVIEYRPTFEQDGIYYLFVNGKDKSGNIAGTDDYKISFEVINKSTITNVLNYPNPFSTSTAFVFTLTGAEIPSQFKIQILTVTGKVVREITRQEMGMIHVGRNITDYKWDGRDQYGQLLGNGVYLYRVVTSMNGKSIEHRSDMDGNPNNNNVDKFFKNGWGKMYIMR